MRSSISCGPGGTSISGPEHRLDALTSDELLAGATLLVPLGATEQHGPHLPLGTDTTMAVAWADRVADGLQRSGVPVLVAPALPYGSSGEHQAFAGTLSIGHDVLRSLLVELTRSAADRFDRVVYLSGHAGNHEPVTSAVRQLAAEGHRVVSLFPSWSVEDGWTTDAHAGRTETSLMLHLDPDGVRLNRLAPGDDRPLRDTLPLMVTGGIQAVSPSGVLGDPTASGPDEGRALFDDLVDRTVQLLLDRDSG